MANKPPSDGTPPRGRAAAGNPDNRFHAQRVEAFDDGWTPDEALPLRTTLSIDHSRTAISRNDSPDIPFDRSVNPYRGCEHGCIYCYARPTHAWLDLSPGLDFESRLFQRPDLPRQLRRELAAPGYRAAPLALATVTDAYQPVERATQLTRQLLALLAETRHPVSIITKSALIERDLDLLGDLAADNLVEVACSLTTLDQTLARQLEPRAASPARRLQTLEALSAAGIPTRVAVAPVIPVLTEPELEALLTAAREAGACDASYTLLRLPLEVAPLFRTWLGQYRPEVADPVMNRLQASRGGRDYDSRFGSRMTGEGVYADLLGQRFRLAVRRLGFPGLSQLRCDLFRAPAPDGQLALF